MVMRSGGCEYPIGSADLGLGTSLGRGFWTRAHEHPCSPHCLHRRRQHGQRRHRRLLRGLLQPSQVLVVEPHAPQRDKLRADFGLDALAAGDARLAQAAFGGLGRQAQLFGEAAAPLKAWVGGALHLSVMAGITTASLGRATGSTRIVRSMPNTPALIGQGIAGLFACPDVTAAERAAIDAVLAPTGRTLWVDREADLDAVTALSGSARPISSRWSSP